MVDRLKSLLAPPLFSTEEDNRIAGILNAILLTLLTASIVLTVIMVLFGNNLIAMALFVITLIISGCFLLMRGGYLRSAGIVVLLS